MKNFLKILVLSVMLYGCNNNTGFRTQFLKESNANDIFINCTPYKYRLNKSYFNNVMEPLTYIKFSPPNKIFFDWSEKKNKFQRKSNFKMSQTYYFISKNINSGISDDRMILSLTRGIKINRVTGSLWMGSKNKETDAEDMFCVKINESEIPKKTEIKKLF